MARAFFDTSTGARTGPPPNGDDRTDGDRAAHDLRDARAPHEESWGVPEQDVAHTYERFAPLYDRLFGWVLDPGRKAMTQAASALNPVSVLEVGVGTGLTLADYPQSTRITGIDLSAGMLARAHQRAARMPERDITLHRMNAECMDFPDNSFDCVAVCYVLSVTPDVGRLVKELQRVCKPGGRILIVNHFSGSRFWWVMERAVRPLARYVGFRSEFGFEDNVLAHDWALVSVRPVNLFSLSKLVELHNVKPGVSAQASASASAAA
jgi:phosphatidylethanolamine/phosphatidyl-N-methylethanolamine N-methyltransferase